MPPTTLVSKIQLFLVCSFLYTLFPTSKAQTQFSFSEISRPIIAFAGTWHSLGPFRVGTREAVWGADPLEATGGFVNTVYNEQSTFRSPLTANATISWTTFELDVEHGVEEATVQLRVHHDNVDWGFQQQVYGWSALQYQTWTRGTLYNNRAENQTAWVYSEGILEFYINARHFFGGDFFGFKRAPVLINLKPGPNTINVRMIRDVRAMGGTNPPAIQATLRVKLASKQPEIDSNLVTVPDLVDGKLPSRYVGLIVRNPLHDWISISNCHRNDTDSPGMMLAESVRIAPGQSRPVAVELINTWRNLSSMQGTVCYGVDNANNQPSDLRLNYPLDLKHRNLTEASKFTFLHPSGVVSYAMLKPPTSMTHSKTKLPLLVVLHGAGLETDSYQVRHSLDDVSDLEAFALFPTGMSPWSGDDWHLWGTADIFSAVNAVRTWVSEMEWNGTVPKTDRVVITGHSNGGQGAWYFATHFPDSTIAAAPLSGYTSIENYVPYSMWSEADPLKSNVVNTARVSYRHELLLDNLHQIPILQQHGSADDNVPPYHSRLMSTLRSGLNMSSQYVEISGKTHWWDQALTTPPLQEFYRQHLKPNEDLGDPLWNFSIVVPPCGEVGSKFGIAVDQLQNPDRLGRVEVIVSNDEDGQNWYLETTNIRRLHFNSVTNIAASSVHISSSSKVENLRIDNFNAPSLSCVREDERSWDCSERSWTGLNERHGKQSGAMDAILRSEGCFQIVICNGNLDLAIQISRNLFQYYGADSAILSCDQYTEALEQPGNMILLVSKISPPLPQLKEFPITIIHGDIFLYNRRSRQQHVIKGNTGIGAIFLRPLKNQRLELVVWGWDNGGIKQAARLVPSLTGVGQPDFVIIGSKVRYQGHGGMIAAGFLDYHWNISAASYLP